VDERQPVAHLRQRFAQRMQPVGVVVLDLLLIGEHRLEAGLDPEPVRARSGEQRAGIRFLEEGVEVHALRRIRVGLRLEQLGPAGHHEPLAQRHSVDVLHRQPGDAVHLADVQHAHDVGMLEVLERVELAPQPPGGRRVGRVR